MISTARGNVCETTPVSPVTHAFPYESVTKTPLRACRPRIWYGSHRTRASAPACRAAGTRAAYRMPRPTGWSHPFVHGGWTRTRLTTGRVVRSRCRGASRKDGVSEPRAGRHTCR
eukprot:3903851-Pleurochrysis_carterae.AAC.2